MVLAPSLNKEKLNHLNITSDQSYGMYKCWVLMCHIRVCTSWYVKLEPTGRVFLENLRNTLITCLPPSVLLVHLTIHRAALLKGLLKPKKKKEEECASRYVYVFGKLSQVRS